MRDFLVPLSYLQLLPGTLSTFQAEVGSLLGQYSSHCRTINEVLESVLPLLLTSYGKHERLGFSFFQKPFSFPSPIISPFPEFLEHLQLPQCNQVPGHVFFQSVQFLMGHLVLSCLSSWIIARKGQEQDPCTFGVLAALSTELGPFLY